jgi:hypothetical protein
VKYFVPRSWLAFCFCLALLFFIRGLILLSLYPPLEGFDEHQHIAYLVYMWETGEQPEYGKARIPPSLYSDLAANPQPDYGWQQLKSIGVMRYGEFWEGSRRAAADAGLDLYGAFHPPLYYRLFAPLFMHLRSVWGFRGAVYSIRMVNLFIAAVSVILFLYPARRLLPEPAQARLAALAVSLLPMYLVYVARVSPDAAGLLFCSLIFFVLSGINGGRRLYPLALLTGALIGIGMRFRVSVLAMLPAAACYLIFLSASGRLGWRRLSLCMLCLLAPFVVTGYGYFAWNVQSYGMAIPGQEEIAMAARGEGISRILESAEPGQLWSFFIKRMIAGNLWTSGWSFLEPPRVLHRAFFAAVSFCLCGLIAALVRRRSGRISVTFDELREGILCALFWAVVCIAAYLHALSTLAAYGTVIYTPAYYAMPGFLPFLVFSFAALNGYGSRLLAFIVTAAVAALFVWTEFYSLFFIAVPYWAGSREFGPGMSRLASVHPSFPGPAFLPALLMIYMVSLVLMLTAVCVSITAGRGISK